MIKKMLRIAAVSMLVVTGLIATAPAQESARTKNLKIDFEFYAGNKLMPAGNYRVKLLPNTTSHKLLLIEQVDGGAQTILASVPNQNKSKLKPGSLVFNKYGDRYFFSGARLGDAGYLHTILKTKAEREVARQVAKSNNSGKSDKVVTSSVQ